MKGTKKSLFVSVLSLVLCVAMLLGTTYAWFTDSVQSGKNTITAGNLDVELTHSNGKVTDENVDGATKLFNVAKWEPGVVAYENFTVKNVGNLALKYKLQLGLYDYNTLTVDNVARSLADVLKVSVQQGTFNGTREEAMALAKEENKTVSDFVKESKLGASGTESANDIYSVIIYWEPSEKDNLYNVNNGRTVDKLHDGKNELFIEFGVHLVATQDTVEADFYDKFYDKNATYDQMPNFKKATGSKETSRTSDVNAGLTENDLKIEINAKDLTGTEVKLGDAEVPSEAIDGVLDEFLEPMPKNIPEDTVIQDDVVFTLNVETTSVKSDATVLDITMFGEATRTETDGEGETKVIASKSGQITELEAPVLVPLKLQAGLKNLKTTHTHTDKATGSEEVTEMIRVDSVKDVTDGKFFYSEETGDFLARMSKFSEVKITYDPIADVARIGNVGYPSLYNAFEASKSGDIVTVLQNSTMPAVSKANIALDLNGFNVSGIAVENSTLGVNGNGALSVTVGAAAMLNVEDGEHESLTLYGAGDVNINGGKYSAVVFGKESTNTLKVTGGEFLLTEEADIQKIEASLADGIYLKAGENNWYSASPFEDYHVAKIGNKPFTSLNAALSAAKVGDTITVLNNVTENVTVTSAGERSNDNIVIDLNGKTLTGSVKLYDCDTVTLKNGNVIGNFIIGEHKSTIVKWQYIDKYPLNGFHPLAPAKNIVFDNLNVQAPDNVNLFTYTNIEDDLTRANASNPFDRDLYGRYIYKTGYQTQEQSEQHKYDEVFTTCSDKDSVTIKGGNYQYTTGKATGNMYDINGKLYTEVLNIVGGTFSDDGFGRFVNSNKYLVGNTSNSFSVSNEAASTYAARIHNVYYTYTGGADDAIRFAVPGETVYINENCSAAKNLLKDQTLTVVSETKGVEWTGATTDELHYVIEKTINGDEITYYTKFEAVAAVYKTTNNQNAPALTEANKVGEYATIADAFNAANANGQNSMVILLKDYTGGDEVEFVYSKITKHAGAHTSTSVRFDLNGHTWTYTGTNAALASTNSSGSSAKATYICDTSAGKTGKILAEKGYCYYKYNSSTENTFFASGTFEALKKEALYFDKIASDSKAGLVEIKGGTYISKSSNLIYIGWKSSSGKLIISGGSFIGATGKKIVGGMSIIPCEISGGTFNCDISSSANITTKTTIVSDKSAVDNGDGTWTVK